MHSDTTLVCLVQPGFSEFEGENFFPADSLHKKIFWDKTKICRQAKI